METELDVRTKHAAEHLPADSATLAHFGVWGLRWQRAYISQDTLRRNRRATAFTDISFGQRRRGMAKVE
jgi:hypothetical protein